MLGILKMSGTNPQIPSANGEPAWEAAYMLPAQGDWNEEDFLRLHTNRMAELVNGRLEILPMPTWLHQLILDFLLERIKEHLRKTNCGGKILMAPLPTRLFARTIREPDLLYVKQENLPKDIRGYPDKIDLAIEIVSSGTEARQRDYVDKRADYAKAGVAEYWIVDPDDSLVTVLVLTAGEYQVAQECRPDDIARSVLLSGLEIPVNQIWALADES
ncbi:MAG: Uma2 family endonuclease [Pirellulaceae bacterium]|nr:Uma2 family endonuclease [Pirellulaceae bacterium]